MSVRKLVTSSLSCNRFKVACTSGLLLASSICTATSCAAQSPSMRSYSASPPSSSSASDCSNSMGYSFLSRKDMAELDQTLMNDENGFSVDQLMELAGLSVAQSAVDYLGDSVPSKVLVLCGSGNNGGDGLVAARHLRQFGAKSVDVVYPRQPPKSALYERLIRQCNKLGISVVSERRDWEALITVDSMREYDLIIDAVFGFSFRPPLAGTWKDILSAVESARKECSVPVMAVDIPSGWDVDRGQLDSEDVALTPSVVISLTAPKLCMQEWLGPHYLGGRFVTPELFERYDLTLPDYPLTKQFVRLDQPLSSSKL